MQRRSPEQEARRTSLIALFCLMERDLSGYSLRRLLKRWRMTEYLRISPATIYRSLTRLQEQSLVESRVEQNQNYPPATVYCITEDGKQAYREYLREEAAFSRSEYAVDLFLGLCAYLPASERIGLVRAWKQGASETVDRLQARVDKQDVPETYGKPYAEWLLLHHEIHQLKAEMQWMDHYITLIESGKA